MKQTKTKEPSRGKTSIRAKLNVRRDTPSDHFTVVIQIIRHRRRSVLFTPYRLRAEEFDAAQGLARTRLRSPAHRAYIEQVNDYLRYHIGELRRLVADMEQSGVPFSARTYRDATVSATTSVTSRPISAASSRSFAARGSTARRRLSSPRCRPF